MLSVVRRYLLPIGRHSLVIGSSSIFGPVIDAVIRFETLACMSEDAELSISEKDWERMFPPLLVA